jgi:hypothetical protein
MTHTHEENSPKFIKRSPNKDEREVLNQNLQPDIQKINATIKKITEKRAPYSELLRLDGFIDRLKATVAIQLRQDD